VRRKLTATIAVAWLAFVTDFTPRVAAQSGTTLTIDGSRLFQVIDGFGVNANAHSWNNGELRPAIDLLVDQLGASIWRVAFDNVDWEATNDNADPNVFNWTYYNGVYTSPDLEELWSTIAYLNQKGVSNGLILSFGGNQELCLCHAQLLDHGSNQHLGHPDASESGPGGHAGLGRLRQRVQPRNPRWPRLHATE